MVSTVIRRRKQNLTSEGRSIPAPQDYALAFGSWLPVAVLVSILSSPALSADSGELSRRCSDFSIAEILHKAESDDGNIESLRYEAECAGRTAATPAGLLRRWHVGIAVSGQRRFAEIGHYSEGIDWKKDLGRCRTFLNGGLLEEFWVHQRRHLIFRTIPEARQVSFERLRIDLLLECTGRWPFSTVLGSEANVVASRVLLREPGWSIDPNFQSVDGMECLVLRSGQHTMWVAPEIGFAVVRRMSALAPGKDFHVIYKNADFAEYAADVWLPRHIERTIYRGNLNSDAYETSQDDVWSSTVQNLSKISVNDVQQEVFKCEVLPGTFTLDNDSGLVRYSSGGLEMLDQVAATCVAIMANNGENERTSSLLSIRLLAAVFVSILSLVVLTHRLKWRWGVLQ